MLHPPLQRSAEGACIAACGVIKQDLGGLRLRVHKTHKSATTLLGLPLLDTYLLQCSHTGKTVRELSLQLLQCPVIQIHNTVRCERQLSGLLACVATAPLSSAGACVPCMSVIWKSLISCTPFLHRRTRDALLTSGLGDTKLNLVSPELDRRGQIELPNDE
jgi:hypothetical protein